MKKLLTSLTALTALSVMAVGLTSCGDDEASTSTESATAETPAENNEGTNNTPVAAPTMEEVVNAQYFSNLAESLADGITITVSTSITNTETVSEVKTDQTYKVGDIYNYSVDNITLSIYLSMTEDNDVYAYGVVENNETDSDDNILDNYTDVFVIKDGKFYESDTERDSINLEKIKRNEASYVSDMALDSYTEYELNDDSEGLSALASYATIAKKYAKIYKYAVTVLREETDEFDYSQLAAALDFTVNADGTVTLSPSKQALNMLKMTVVDALFSGSVSDDINTIAEMFGYNGEDAFYDCLVTEDENGVTGISHIINQLAAYSLGDAFDILKSMFGNQLEALLNSVDSYVNKNLEDTGVTLSMLVQKALGDNLVMVTGSSEIDEELSLYDIIEAAEENYSEINVGSLLSMIASMMIEETDESAEEVVVQSNDDGGATEGGSASGNTEDEATDDEEEEEEIDVVALIDAAVNDFLVNAKDASIAETITKTAADLNLLKGQTAESFLAMEQSLVTQTFDIISKFNVSLTTTTAGALTDMSVSVKDLTYAKEDDHSYVGLSTVSTVNEGEIHVYAGNEKATAVDEKTVIDLAEKSAAVTLTSTDIYADAGFALNSESGNFEKELSKSTATDGSYTVQVAVAYKVCSDYMQDARYDLNTIKSYVYFNVIKRTYDADGNLEDVSDYYSSNVNIVYFDKLDASGKYVKESPSTTTSTTTTETVNGVKVTVVTTTNTVNGLSYDTVTVAKA